MTHGKPTRRAGAGALAFTFSLLLPAATAAQAFAPEHAGQNSSGAAAHAAEDDFARGQRLLAGGDAAGAADAFKSAAEARKTDADAWYNYGLALTRARNAKDARKAFERAVQLRPDSADAQAGLAFTLLMLGKEREAEASARRALAASPRQAEAHYVSGVVRSREEKFDAALAEAEAALRDNPDFAAAAYLASDALLNLFFDEGERTASQYPISADAGRDEIRLALEKREPAVAPFRTRMRELAERLEAFAAARPQDPDAAVWREQAQSLRIYGGRPEGRGPGDVYTSTQVTTKAVILNKPEPPYTEEARAKRTSGVVRLRAVLGADGRVRNVVAVRRLPNGLTESAVEVARRIRFTPATLGGRPVSQVVMLEYHFEVR